MGLYNNHFYHRLTKKYIQVFGALFNSIDVVKYSTDKQEIKRERCALKHSPKEKFVSKLRSDLNLGEDAAGPDRRPEAIKLPVMSYELESFEYDTARKTQAMRKIAYKTPDGNVYQYTSVPYKLIMTLSVYTKTLDEMYQIMEQILPFFSPEYTVTMYPLDGTTDVEMDVPISLSAIVPSDPYEGTFDDNRMIIWTLSFIMPVHYFGPGRTGKKIFKTTTNIIDKDSNDRILTIEGVPEQDGLPPSEIDPEQDWDYIITEFFGDEDPP